MLKGLPNLKKEMTHALTSQSDALQVGRRVIYALQVGTG